MKTVSELVKAVLRDVNAIDAAEDPSSEDETYISDIYVLKHHEMTDRDLTYWGVDEVPEAIFLVIRDLIVNEIRGTYGEPIPADVKQQRELAIMRKLRYHVHKRSSGLPVKALFY